jgi:drug/metabolite transporter (DMT)-like permease
MIVQGVIFGLLAAATQSLCYVYSRIFVTRPGNTSLALFGLSHAIMGLFGLALLPLCWSDRVYELRAYFWPLMGSVVFYLMGQVCLFRAVKLTDASRVSPLLGLKILVLALITVLAFDEPLTTLQWIGVLLSIAAAAGLNYSGGGQVPLNASAAILGACVFYSLSDLSIVAMTRALSLDGGFRGILLGNALAYTLAGAVGAALVGINGPQCRRPAQWREAVPVAVTWFLAMIFLFICFRMLGAVFGNIVQSMRGPLSILIGLAIAHAGHAHLEQKVGAWTFIRRFAAAILMCAAIAIFVHEKARMETPPKALTAQPARAPAMPDAAPLPPSP